MAPVPSLSVDGAIELMQTLPLDEDPELVLRVVRKTLRSTGISVEEVVASAQRREEQLVTSVEELEREIAASQARLRDTMKQLDDTRTVWEQLQEALATESKVGMSSPPGEVKPSVPVQASSKRAPPPPPVIAAAVTTKVEIAAPPIPPPSARPTVTAPPPKPLPSTGPKPGAPKVAPKPPVAAPKPDVAAAAPPSAEEAAAFPSVSDAEDSLEPTTPRSVTEEDWSVS